MTIPLQSMKPPMRVQRFELSSSAQTHAQSPMYWVGPVNYAVIFTCVYGKKFAVQSKKLILHNHFLLEKSSG